MDEEMEVRMLNLVWAWVRGRNSWCRVYGSGEPGNVQRYLIVSPEEDIVGGERRYMEVYGGEKSRSGLVLGRTA
jgi:hypothetical protein